MLLISLAMLVVAGVIWGSFSAVSASAAAARTRKSAEQNVRAAYTKGDVADSATPKDAPAAPVNETGVQSRNRTGDSVPAEKGNAGESGERTRARDGSGFGNSPNYEAREERREQNRSQTENSVCDGSCDEDCSKYETREERREQNRVKAESRVRDRSGGENCDENCPNYETREERREQNRAQAEDRVCDGSCGENCDENCSNYETREERREQNRSGSDTGYGGRGTQGRFQGDKRP